MKIDLSAGVRTKNNIKTKGLYIEAFLLFDIFRQ